MKAKIFVGPKNCGQLIVAHMISQYIGTDKTVIINAEIVKVDSQFIPYEIPENTQMFIFENLPLDFDFEKFFPCVDNRCTGGDLTFSIRIEKREKKTKIIQIPYLIFTTNQLDRKWHDYGVSFYGRFDIVTFPLAEIF